MPTFYRHKTELAFTKNIPLSQLLDEAEFKDILSLTNPDLPVLLRSSDPVVRAIYVRAPKKHAHLKGEGPLMDEMVDRVLKPDGRRHSRNSKKYVYEDKKASYSTIRERKQVALQVAGALQRIDPALPSLSALEPWHVAIVYIWGAARGLSHKAFNVHGVFFRHALRVLGFDPAAFLPARNEIILTRIGVTTRYVAGAINRGFPSDGPTPEQMVADFMNVNPRMGNQLQLAKEGVLRPREAALFRPNEDCNPLTGRVHIRHGTKGGRGRFGDDVVDPEGLRDAITALVPFANTRTGSTVPDSMTLLQWRGKMYRTAAKLGYTRKGLGVTFYSLRHHGLQEIYREDTGALPPVAGGGDVAEAVDRRARTRVKRQAGHGRFSSSNPYLGPSPHRHDDTSTADSAQRPTGEMRRQLRGPFVRKKRRRAR